MRSQHVRAMVSQARAPFAADSLILVFLLSSTWLLVAVVLSETSVAVASAGRTAFATIGLGVIASRAGVAPHSGGSSHLREPDAVLSATQVAFLAATGVSAYSVFSTVSVQIAGPTVPALVLSVAPLAVLAVESVLYRTLPTRRTLVSMIIAVGGVGFLISNRAAAHGESSWLGVAFAIAALASMLFYTTYFARLSAGYGGGLSRLIFPIFLVGCVPLLLWAIIDVATGARVTRLALLGLAVLGLGVYTPAYLLQHRILSRLGASFASALGLAVPPVVFVFEVAFGISSSPTPMQWLTALVIFAAIVACVRSLQPTPTEGSRHDS